MTFDEVVVIIHHVAHASTERPAGQEATTDNTGGLIGPKVELHKPSGSLRTRRSGLESKEAREALRRLKETGTFGVKGDV